MYRYYPDERPCSKLTGEESASELMTRYSRGENIPHEALLRAIARDELADAEPGTTIKGAGFEATKHAAPPSVPSYTRFDQMPADWK